MLFTYADKNTPFVLSPESLDWYLGKGWYRMGANIFTTHFLFFKEQPYSAIWIRVDLENFSFSKRQRKLLRKNAQLFDTTAGKGIIDGERESLYQVYARNFDGRLSPSIKDSLEAYDGESVFNTYETTVREKVSGKMVAASYFDLGATSAASILGYYNQDLSSFSLGYYTMLLEIQYCLDAGIRYYYPGYIVPGYERFDYKKRLGKSEFFDLKTESWKPLDEEYLRQEGPTEVQVRALTELQEHLNRSHDAPFTLAIYPLFEAGLYDIWNDDYLPYPYCIPLMVDVEGNAVIVAYDPKDREYLLLHCLHMVQTQMLFNPAYLNGFPKSKYFTDLLAIRQIVHRTKDVKEIAGVCQLAFNHPEK